MIVYGWSTSELSSIRPKEIECFECQKKGQMFVRSFIRTCHLFWIPIFPYKLWQEVSCVHCGAEITFKEMGQELRGKYQQYKKFPLPRPWHFSGLIIVLGLFLWGMKSKSDKKEKILSRAENIQIGRIIEYKINQGAYSTMKVYNIQDDTIMVLHNLYEVEKKEGINKIQFPENYGKDTLIVFQDSLLKWVNEGIVLDIYW